MKRESKTKTTAAHEKAAMFVIKPTERLIIPNKRNMAEILRLFFNMNFRNNAT